MKRKLGLEAMLEYMSNFLHNVEKCNPEIQLAVLKAVQLINVEKIYNEAKIDNELPQ